MLILFFLSVMPLQELSQMKQMQNNMYVKVEEYIGGMFGNSGIKVVQFPGYLLQNESKISLQHGNSRLLVEGNSI